MFCLTLSLDCARNYLGGFSFQKLLNDAVERLGWAIVSKNKQFQKLLNAAVFNIQESQEKKKTKSEKEPNEERNSFSVFFVSLFLPPVISASVLCSGQAEAQSKGVFSLQL